MRSPAFLVLVTGLGSVFRWRIGSRNRRDDLLHPAQSAAQVNPAYLAAERKENEMAKKNNRKTLTARRKQMESKGTFLLDSYVEKKIGNVGSGKAYYQSGK